MKVLVKAYYVYFTNKDNVNFKALVYAKDEESAKNCCFNSEVPELTRDNFRDIQDDEIEQYWLEVDIHKGIDVNPGVQTSWII